jgi:hypothetical protein
MRGTRRPAANRASGAADLNGRLHGLRDRRSRHAAAGRHPGDSDRGQVGSPTIGTPTDITSSRDAPASQECNMADWTASSNSVVRPYRSPYGSPNIKYFEVSTAASTNKIKTGDFVQFDTSVSSASHRIAKAASTGGNAVNLLGINGNALLGIAMQPDESDGSTLGLGTNRTIGVALFDGVQEFLGYVRGAGPVTSTMIGQQRSVIHDSTLRIWQIDSTNSTAALQTVIITDVPAAYIGDTGAPVAFKIALSTLVSLVAKG